MVQSSASLRLAPSPVKDRRYSGGRAVNAPWARRPVAAPPVASLIAFFVAAALYASDPVPVQTEPDSASISAAKQQLDEMRSANVAAGAGVHAKLTPTLPLTPLNPTADYVPPPAKAKPGTLRQRRSENWLVDAVMRPDPRDRSNRDGRNGNNAASEPHAFGNATTSADDELSPLDRDTFDADDPLEAGTLSAERSAPTASRPNSGLSALDKPDRTADFDPLAKYLTDWLSPQDLSLLKNVDPSSGSMSLPGGTTGLPNPSGDLAGVAAPRGLDAFTPNGGGTPGKPEDNPFLQFLKSPEPTMAPQPPPVESTPGLASPLPVSPPDASAKAAIPDFAKPAFDDKYWKPLKRF